MRNVTTRIEKDRLTIEIDVGPAALKAAPPSKSGKTKVIASTEGNVVVDEASGLTLGLNLYTKA